MGLKAESLLSLKRQRKILLKSDQDGIESGKSLNELLVYEQLKSDQDGIER